MRSRERIEYDVNKYGTQICDEVMIELLLDIRDLLKAKRS